MARLFDDHNEVDRVTRPICMFFSPGKPQREKKQKISTSSFPFHTTPYNSLMALGPHVSTPGSRILLTGARAELIRRPRKDGHQRRNFFFLPFFPEFCCC